MKNELSHLIHLILNHCVFLQAAGNAVKRASGNLVKAAQKAAFDAQDDQAMVVKHKMVEGIAQVRQRPQQKHKYKHRQALSSTEHARGVSLLLRYKKRKLFLNSVKAGFHVQATTQPLPLLSLLSLLQCTLNSLNNYICCKMNSLGCDHLSAIRQELQSAVKALQQEVSPHEPTIYESARTDGCGLLSNLDPAMHLCVELLSDEYEGLEERSRRNGIRLVGIPMYLPTFSAWMSCLCWTEPTATQGGSFFNRSHRFHVTIQGGLNPGQLDLVVET